MKKALTFEPPSGIKFELEEPNQNTGASGQDMRLNLSGENAGKNNGESSEKLESKTANRNKAKRGMRKPIRLGSKEKDDKKQENKKDVVTDPGELEFSGDLKKDLSYLKKVFHAAKNSDIVFREFSIGLEPPVQAAIIFIDGMTNNALQNSTILQPLMLLSRLRLGDVKGTRLDIVRDKLLPGNQVETFRYMREAIDLVLNGDSLVLIDGVNKCLGVETKGWESRGVEKPEVEMVIAGPQESFSETFRVNTALIRKAFRSPDLVTEIFKIGKKDRLLCGILYLEGVVNTELVKEVKRRVTQLDTDYIGSSGLLEQFIEDNTFALAPQVLSTERPDRVINHIIDGKVAVILDGSPRVLVMPITLFNILQTAEDAYVRWPYGTLLRSIRALGLFLALFLPGIYVAVTTYHHEMIPTDLLMAIAASRERVPFPTIVEILIMEISFELIREAGLRVPGVIGPTLGIVGALILGQAAVAANIVSPILIVIVAVTAIGSFTVPNYTLSFSVRAARFMFILFGSFLGIFGLTLGFFIMLHHLAAIKSFGVPFLSPIGSSNQSASDVFIRKPAWEQEKRTGFVFPMQKDLQPHISRRWILGNRGGNKNGTGK